MISEKENVVSTFKSINKISSDCSLANSTDGCISNIIPIICADILNDSPTCRESMSVNFENTHSTKRNLINDENSSKILANGTKAIQLSQKVPDESYMVTVDKCLMIKIDNEVYDSKTTNDDSRNSSFLNKSSRSSSVRSDVLKHSFSDQDVQIEDLKENSMLSSRIIDSGHTSEFLQKEQ